MIYDTNRFGPSREERNAKRFGWNKRKPRGVSPLYGRERKILYGERPLTPAEIRAPAHRSEPKPFKAPIAPSFYLAPTANYDLTGKLSKMFVREPRKKITWGNIRKKRVAAAGVAFAITYGLLHGIIGYEINRATIRGLAGEIKREGNLTLENLEERLDRHRLPSDIYIADHVQA